MLGRIRNVVVAVSVAVLALFGFSAAAAPVDPRVPPAAGVWVYFDAEQLTAEIAADAVRAAVEWARLEAVAAEADRAAEAAAAVRTVPNTPRPVPADVGDVVALGERLAAGYGWTGSEWTCLFDLWAAESGWHVTAHNRSSGAHGIPQAVPGSKMGPGWEDDANVQITWGLGYIAARYGAPCAAWARFRATNSY